MELHALVNRARNECLEMPGLQLTPQLAARFWGLEPTTCQSVIDALIAGAFLRWTPNGRVARDEHAANLFASGRVAAARLT